ncbi:serine hydrolase domain-containing protein [Candidatus Latescibacterota bacterium]
MKMRKITNAIFLLTVLLLVFNCKEKPIYSESEIYSQEIEDRIERVINNLLVETLETSHTNKYEKSTLESRLSYYQTPGISIAVINEGKVEWSRGFGVKDWDTQEPVNQNTLFQVASVSKPITALAIMKLKESNSIDLDKDVNEYLKSWKIPSNGDWHPKVTLRQLLSHTGGLTVSGFPGYKVNAELPTTVEVLNGKYPSNTPPIETDILPGTQWRYSGGGLTVAQLVLEDLFNKPFYSIMDSLLIKPLNLSSSTFQQPIPQSKLNLVATGHPQKYQAIKGGHHIYPEMAAAGLWTTSSELAQIIVEVQKAISGQSEYISTESIEEMLTPQKIASWMGMGFMIAGEGENISFSHSGSNEGFNSVIMAYKDFKKGAVVLFNSNQGRLIGDEILKSIAKEYDWAIDWPDEKDAIDCDEEILNNYVGEYKTDNDLIFLVGTKGKNLTLTLSSQNPINLIPESETKFYSNIINLTIEFSTNKDNNNGITIVQAEGPITAKRIK